MDSGAKSMGAVTLDDRIRGAIWGEFVGDAYCLGSHWIYDLAELARVFPGGPQGFDTPAPGHYHFGKHSGEFTHYGDAALLQLQSLGENEGFDAADFGSRFVSLMEAADYHGYRDHAAKDTVAKARQFREAHPGEVYPYQNGADDDQPATVSRLAPLAALYFRDAAYPAVIEKATRVCQNNHRAVAYALAHGIMLRELFSGKGLLEAGQMAAAKLATEGTAGAEVAEKIALAIANRERNVIAVTLDFGQSCPLEHSFPAALQCALHHEGDFPGALRATAFAGGDSAGRAAMVGAWLGAALGLDAIPVWWRDRLAAKNLIAACVAQIVMLQGRAA